MRKKPVYIKISSPFSRCSYLFSSKLNNDKKKEQRKNMFSNVEFLSNEVHQIDKLVNLSKTMQWGYMLIHIDIEDEGVYSLNNYSKPTSSRFFRRNPIPKFFEFCEVLEFNFLWF